MRHFPSTIAISIALATAAWAAPAAAQDAPAAPVVESDSGLGDIVVTAQRREESLQDVPVSVSVLSGDTLGAITSTGADVRVLAGRVPSLNIESSFGRTFPRFYIRGLGNTDFDLNASQPVSLVYDDVVLENPILKGFPIFDLDRVEVLRGPQGTLFGRNTPAGIVKFDTVKPGKTGGYARVSYGRYGTSQVEVAAGAADDSGFSVRLSTLFQHRDDWVDNIATTKKDDLGGYDDIAARLQLQYENGPFTGRVTGQVRVYDGSAIIFRANTQVPGSNKLVGLGGAGTEFERDKVWQDGINFQKLNTYNAALNLEYDFGPVTAYSITSYWNGNFRSRGDIDGGFGAAFLPESGPGLIPFQAQSQDNVPSLDQFTQEIRIASNNSGGLGYQFGAFYFDEKLDISSFEFGGPTDATPSAIAVQRQDSEAYGIFGSVNYAFDNGFKLQAGARYNHDTRDFVASRPVETRPDFVVNPNTPVPPQAARVKGKLLTWDASATYEASDALTLYARVARGYRAPSVQGRLTFARTISTADQEETMSYEAGIKTAFLDDRVRFNLTGYFFDTKDLQLTAVGGTANVASLLNVDAKGHGIEAELQAAPARGLTFSVGGAWNVAEIDDANAFVAGCGSATPCTILDPQRPGSPGIFSIDGNQLPQSPKWTLNWTAGYEIPVGDGAIYAFTDWYYRSKVQFFLYRSVEFSDDKMIEGGLRVGYKTDRFDVAAFVRNITNDESPTGGIDFNNLTSYVNEPRIYGVEAGFKF
ncbi:iron complex outermembrane receptor protein [Sphingopyxis italica]|uniref:Iron complex outermembrane receptor protein n=1 Tax=Sphingopyxis italica TaxID=1129133 RepID=A0A7X6BA79_9SPHN|nr:TonB-dependent receptor [Sphingopyxis italica]NJB91084.1 iron complex outermembrane receptor protein [Sphingopyxis italica]